MVMHYFHPVLEHGLPPSLNLNHNAYLIFPRIHVKRESMAHGTYEHFTFCQSLVNVLITLFWTGGGANLPPAGFLRRLRSDLLNRKFGFKSQRSYGFLITKELIFGFQILDLKDHFSASLKNQLEANLPSPPPGPR